MLALFRKGWAFLAALIIGAMGALALRLHWRRQGEIEQASRDDAAKAKTAVEIATEAEMRAAEETAAEKALEVAERTIDVEEQQILKHGPSEEEARTLIDEAERER